MTAYALLRGIEYIYEECPFAVGSTSIAYKELLNRLENERPGAKLSFYLSFLEARSAVYSVSRRRCARHYTFAPRAASRLPRPVCVRSADWFPG
jgi:tRNA(Ile)-lysidine synthase TilS/MesJ